MTVSSPPAYSIGLKAFEVGSAHRRGTGTAGATAVGKACLTGLEADCLTSHVELATASLLPYSASPASNAPSA